jgi:phosphatidylglycerophosphate synthase
MIRTVGSAAGHARAALHGPLPSILSVAVLTGAIGWLLTSQADWSGRHILASLAGYGVVAGAVALAWAWRFGRRSFGLPNQITLLRFGLACLIGGTLLASGAGPILSWSMAALIATALSLDAVDGWLARRRAQASAFGARFDLEVDALLLLILALLLWQTGRVGPWVLAIGLLRYGFVGAGWLLAWLRRPLPPSFRRKTVCAIQGIGLLLALLPPVPAALAAALAGIALTALIASFAIDIWWLAQHRPSVVREPRYGARDCTAAPDGLPQRQGNG